MLGQRKTRACTNSHSKKLMTDLDIYRAHLITLANAYERKAELEEDPRKAYLIGQAKGLLEALSIMDEYILTEETYEKAEIHILGLLPGRAYEDDGGEH